MARVYTMFMYDGYNTVIDTFSTQSVFSTSCVARRGRRGTPRPALNLRHPVPRATADLRRQGPRYPVPCAFRPAWRQFPAGARRAVPRRCRLGRKSAPARPTGMRVTAGMREVVKTRNLHRPVAPASLLQRPWKPRLPAVAGDFAGRRRRPAG